MTRRMFLGLSDPNLPSGISERLEDYFTEGDRYLRYPGPRMRLNTKVTCPLCGKEYKTTQTAAEVILKDGCSECWHRDPERCKTCGKKAWEDGHAGVAFQVKECDDCELPTCETCAEPDYDLQGDPPQYVCTGWQCPKCRRKK